MPFLFSYGTLQEKNVQMSLFGRFLEGRPDELVGFEQSLIEIEDSAASGGATRHAIVKFNGNNNSRVSGTVFEVSEMELARTDEYEPADYKRIAATLASGTEAWVYART